MTDLFGSAAFFCYSHPSMQSAVCAFTPRLWSLICLLLDTVFHTFNPFPILRRRFCRSEPSEFPLSVNFHIPHLLIFVLSPLNIFQIKFKRCAFLRLDLMKWEVIVIELKNCLVAFCPFTFEAYSMDFSFGSLHHFKKNLFFFLIFPFQFKQ